MFPDPAPSVVIPNHYAISTFLSCVGYPAESHEEHWRFLAILELVAAHPRGKEGQIVYDLREDFGAEPAEIRAPFAFYQDQFAVREEVA